MSKSESTAANKVTVASVTAREAYDAKIAIQAVQRVGRNPQLHGTVHELMFVDRLNIQPRNILRGARATLTQSTSATRDDVIVTQANKVIQRFQLKDTTRSIHRTVDQVAKGKYARTNLMGTKETTRKFADAVAKRSKSGAGVTQKMGSTGISSTDTTRIASKGLGKVPSVRNVAASAGKAGIWGGVIAGGMEAASAARQLKNGEITGGQFAGRVAKEGAKGAATGASSAAASTYATAAISTILTTTTAPAWVPIAAGVGAAVAVGSGVKWLCDRVFG